MRLELLKLKKRDIEDGWVVDNFEVFLGEVADVKVCLLL
jgi:hypothetical protein